MENAKSFLSGFFSAYLLTELFEAFAFACTFTEKVLGSLVYGDPWSARKLDAASFLVFLDGKSLPPAFSEESFDFALGMLKFWTNFSKTFFGIDMILECSSCQV